MRVLTKGGRPVPELRCNRCGALIARYEVDQHNRVTGSPILPASIALSLTGLLPCPRCQGETDISLPNFCLNWYLWVINNTRIEPTFV
jgi:hypothetical protein